MPDPTRPRHLPIRDAARAAFTLRTDVSGSSFAAGDVDPAGGNAGKGIVPGVSVITAGEALGHWLWCDAEFLDQVAEGFADGRKCRFGHPRSDTAGMVAYLGRFLNPARDGNRVRGRPAHVRGGAAGQPEKRREYVLAMAVDPTAFGTSIVFDHDPEAETAFHVEHGAVLRDDWFGEYLDLTEFESPDSDNTHNLPHARLGLLRAVDIVGDAAANPDGLFSRDARPPWTPPPVPQIPPVRRHQRHHRDRDRGDAAPGADPPSPSPAPGDAAGAGNSAGARDAAGAGDPRRR